MINLNNSAFSASVKLGLFLIHSIKSFNSESEKLDKSQFKILFLRSSNIVGLFGSIHILLNASQSHCLNSNSLSISASNLAFSASVKLGLFLIHSFRSLNSSSVNFDKSQSDIASIKSLYKVGLFGSIHIHNKASFNQLFNNKALLISANNLAFSASDKFGLFIIKSLKSFNSESESQDNHQL
ncbi:MAG: hypothetical protein U9Q66_02255 [Patescibacteria group bacterium]|nr:hypothetical protein [Patescibacteria group bacterium]